MIYSEHREWKVEFYIELRTGKRPARDFILQLPDSEKGKIVKYIEWLRANDGILDEPYSRHIKGKIRELRVDFGKNRFRIFYFLFIKKTIVILHGFKKDTQKTPPYEITKAEKRLEEVLINHELYG